MTRRQQQSIFVQMVGILIAYIYACGYEATFGDTYPSTRFASLRKKFTFHGKGLAIDINLFKNGMYLEETEDHRKFGEFWKRLHPMCTWGRRF